MNVEPDRMPVERPEIGRMGRRSRHSLSDYSELNRIRPQKRWALCHRSRATSGPGTRPYFQVNVSALVEPRHLLALLKYCTINPQLPVLSTCTN
jgi:hypothetical protein